MFVKYPKEGFVKTRLAADIGEAQAVSAYRKFVEMLYERLSSQNIDLNICYAPKGYQKFFEEWLPASYCDEQVGDDLGSRLEHSFERAFERGYEKVFVVGSDSPDMPLDFMDLALRDQEAAIGRTKDGGYYVLGFTKDGFCKDALRHGVWSSENTYQTTVDILDRSGVNYCDLIEWYDIDTVEDFKCFERDVSGEKSPTSTRHPL